MTSTSTAAPAFAFPIARLLLATMFLHSGVDKLTHLDATAAFIAAGGLPLAQHAISKVLEGITTIEEVYRVALF